MEMEESSSSGYVAALSEAIPVSVEPPEPTPEQLAEWRARVERVRDGTAPKLFRGIRPRPSLDSETYEVASRNASATSSILRPRSFAATLQAGCRAPRRSHRGQQRLPHRADRRRLDRYFEAGLGFLTYWVLGPE